MIFGLNSIKKLIIAEDDIETPILSIVNKDNTSKLYFNLKAMSQLGLTLDEKNQVAISFSNAHKGEIFIMNANKFVSASNLNVSKSRFISSKRYAAEILKSFSINMAEGTTRLEIVGTDREFQDNAIFKLKMYEDDTEEVLETTVEDNVTSLAEEIKDMIEEKELI